MVCKHLFLQPTLNKKGQMYLVPTTISKPQPTECEATKSVVLPALGYMRKTCAYHIVDYSYLLINHLNEKYSVLFNKLQQSRYLYYERRMFTY
uniref:Uncharacterized protein n=1 Tax=Arundo donax TaxID=35708 RepID=A0A0A9EGY2_ARUDO